MSVPYALYAQSSGSYGGLNLPDGINDGDTIVWDSASSSWIINDINSCQPQLTIFEVSNIDYNETTHFSSATITGNRSNTSSWKFCAIKFSITRGLFLFVLIVITK